VGLVAPTAAEYRLLGANEPFLTALRTATGGAEVLTALDPWRHDLRTTSSSTDLWPLLLVIALLLWPLDIALRRVSIGRREFAAAGAWMRDLPRRRRALGRRTVTGETLLAARGRATSAATRAAMRRADRPIGAEPDARAGRRPPPADTPSADTPSADTPSADTPSPAAPGLAPHPGPPASTSADPGSTSADTLARLRDAKRRVRDR
jgi:hypothetical protein